MGNIHTKEEIKKLVCDAIDQCDTVAFRGKVMYRDKDETDYAVIKVIPIY